MNRRRSAINHIRASDCECADIPSSSKDSTLKILPGGEEALRPARTATMPSHDAVLARSAERRDEHE